MIDVLEHPLVAGYLRDLDAALAGLPAAAAAELSEQLRAHLLEALPPMPMRTQSRRCSPRWARPGWPPGPGGSRPAPGWPSPQSSSRSGFRPAR